MRSARRWAAVLLLVAATARAEKLASREEVQRSAFPDANEAVAIQLQLTPPQRALVEKASGIKLRWDKQPVWQILRDHRTAGWLVVDEVFGKHEFITYAVALDPSGAVRMVEILEYRETRGGEVRSPKWRAQFAGKRSADPLRVGREIENIAGATLSCKHITEGVRRVLAIYEVALKARTN